MQVGSELDVHLKVLLGGAVILRGGAGRPSLVGRRCLVKYSPRSRPVPGIFAIIIGLWNLLKKCYQAVQAWSFRFCANFSTFECLEVSFADNSFIVLRMSWKEPAPLDHANYVRVTVWQIKRVLVRCNQVLLNMPGYDFDEANLKYPRNRNSPDRDVPLCCILNCILWLLYYKIYIQNVKRKICSFIIGNWNLSIAMLCYPVLYLSSLHTSTDCSV